MSPAAPKIKITLEKPKSKRVIGKLAQARRAQKAAEQPEEVEDPTPLIFKAMDASPGYAYPTMGQMLKLAGPQFTMSREFGISRPGIVTKMKMAEAKAALQKASAAQKEKAAQKAIAALKANYSTFSSTYKVSLVGSPIELAVQDEEDD